MARKKLIRQPFACAQRPVLAPDANPSNYRIAELDLQQDWQARIDAGLIKVG